ncbi:hypothetical protein ACFLTD_00945 [Elusimicrobiota bacterium]
MDEEGRRIVYDNIEDPWAFVLRATRLYKKEFLKTSKIGQPPKVDDIIVQAASDKDLDTIE